MQTSIFQWADIVADFSQSVILGNGASIAVNPIFSYQSLLKEARSAARLSRGLETIFTRFSTNDFELVLQMLWHAHLVNEALDIKDDLTTIEYALLRAALIDTVRSHHATHETVEQALPKLHAFLRPFTTVISLNYDLLVYWAMLAGNEVYGKWFKDGFIKGVFEEDWRRLRSPYKAAGSTMVFYPHGNLVLAATIEAEEHKLSISQEGRDLLEEVFAAWTSGKYRPVFVSEGESTQKLLAIGRSPYLRRVYAEILPKLGESVAVYGWSAAENDVHILTQVLRDTRRLAFSVFRGTRADAEIDAECFALLSRVASLNSAAAVTFYWADGEGLWNHAT